MLHPMKMKLAFDSLLIRSMIVKKAGKSDAAMEATVNALRSKVARGRLHSSLRLTDCEISSLFII
jgi:hypothetical protein